MEITDKLLDDLLAKYRDQLAGGRGDHLDPNQIDREVLKQGIAVELEHTTDPMIALDVALDHWAEDLDYYTKLAKIDPHHGTESVTLKNTKPREFVTGDDLIEIMTSVASDLYDRGDQELAAEIAEFITTAWK